MFISYKSGVEPAHTLAETIFGGLAAEGHEVFLDRRSLIPGDDWGVRIQREIPAADAFIVLLNRAASNSEMVEDEIRRAHDSFKQQGKPRIIPVRVEYLEEPNYPISAYLNGNHHVHWKREDGPGLLIRSLSAAIGAGAPALEVSHAPMARSTDMEPAFAAPVPPPGGAVALSDLYYVKRKDERVLAIARGNPATLTIRAPRQTGKTSLLFRMADAALKAGKRVATIDLQLLASEMDAPDLFFRSFHKADRRGAGDGR